jgi:hypothetical protein
MRVIRPFVEEVCKVTCSCGCEDYIQINRYLESYRNSFVSKDEPEELYHLEIKHDSSKWSTKTKIRELLLAVKNSSQFKSSGKKEYYHSFDITPEQAQKLFDTLKEDIENFDEDTADFILQGVEEFSPIDKKVDEYTLLMSNFYSNLMWIGADGNDLESPPNLISGFNPFSVSIGWRFDEQTNRRDMLRGWRYFLTQGVKYHISEYDALLSKEDIVSIMGSIKYMLENTFQESELKGVIKL